MSSKINLQTCEYACKSSIFQDNQLIYYKKIGRRRNAAPYKNYKSFFDAVTIIYTLSLKINPHSPTF